MSEKAAFILPGIQRVSGSVTDTTGAYVIFPDDVPTTMTYNGDGTLATEAFTTSEGTFTRTYTYTTGNLTSISGWVRS